MNFSATDDDIGIGAFVPPPSNYQAQQKCDHSAKSVSPTVTVSVSELSLVDVLQHNSILGTIIFIYSNIFYTIYVI